MIGVKMRFKRIYIEITNLCNLNCDFCIKNQRKQKSMNIEEFGIILNKIKKYTNYIYLHVLGEPTLHPNINEFISLAKKKGFNINITTNGYLIDKIKYNKNIRQVNISLHSFQKKYKITLEKYLNNIFECADVMSQNNTYISYRIWTKNRDEDLIIKKLEQKYKIKINGNCKLNNNIFINFEKEFIWPDLNNNIYEKNGKCYGLIDHIGILVDGTIVPCCLDSLGIIKLGNIFNEDLKTILNKEKTKTIINEFKKNIKIEELCKHCKFLKRD